MIFYQIDLNDNLIYDPTLEKTTQQLKTQFTEISSKMIYRCLKIVANIISHESEQTYRKNIPHRSKDYNDYMMAIINSLQDATYPKETGPFSYYRDLPFFLSGDSKELAEGLSHLNYSEEENEAWAKQTPEIATLMKYVIELKRQAMDRYIKEGWPLTKEQQRAIAVKKANAHWGTFQQAATGQKTITEKKENVRFLEGRDNINSL